MHDSAVYVGWVFSNVLDNLLFSPPQDFVVAVGDRVAQLILERFGFQESALFSWLALPLPGGCLPG